MEWNDLHKEIENIFHKKSEKLGLRPDIEIQFIEDTPVEGEFVFGEAFPDENKIWLEVVAPDASTNEITEIVSHELIHLKFPELSHDSKEFEDKVRECMKEQ